MNKNKFVHISFFPSPFPIHLQKFVTYILLLLQCQVSWHLYSLLYCNHIVYNLILKIETNKQHVCEDNIPWETTCRNSTGLKFYYKEKVNQSTFLQRIYSFFYFFFFWIPCHHLFFFFIDTKNSKSFFVCFSSRKYRWLSEKRYELLHKKVFILLSKFEGVEFLFQNHCPPDVWRHHSMVLGFLCHW